MSTALRCTTCGSSMREGHGPHHYRECGLSNVWLADIEINPCTGCDNVAYGIWRLESLHRTIAEAVIHKPTRLRGEEVRFLRKTLGWSGVDFARHMGVAVETVSRWETDAAPIGPQADRLLRLLVAQGHLTTAYPTDRLRQIDASRATAPRLTLEATRTSWRLKTA